MNAATRQFRAHHRAAPYLFLAPVLALVVLLLVYPLVGSIVLSLYKTGFGARRFVGLANYRFLLGDRLFWGALANTTAFAVMFLVIEIPLAVALALILNRADLRGRRFLRFAFFSPYLVSYAFVGVLFGALLSPRRGGLDRLLSALFHHPFELDWLTDPNWATAAVVLAALWLSTGLAIVYVLAALQSVRPDLHDAASVDGARAWSRFIHITLPAIRPVLLLLCVAGTIGAFQLFELPYVLFGQTSGPGSRGLTVVMYLFFVGFEAGDLGYASAIGWALVLILAAATLLQIHLTRLDSDSSAPDALPMPKLIPVIAPKPRIDRKPPDRPEPIANPFHTRPIGIILCYVALMLGAIVTLFPLLWLVCASFRRDDDPALFLPANLSSLTLANYHDVLTNHPFGRWMVNSLFVSSSATLLAVLVSSAAGFALCKYRFVGRTTIAAAMLLTALVPHQVLLPSLFQVMRAIGFVDRWPALIVPGSLSLLGALLYRQAFLAVPDELLAAARADGAGEWRIWLSVAMPLVRPVTSALVLFTFLGNWGALLWPQIVLRDESHFTLPMGLANLASLPASAIPQGMLMAGTVMAIAPVVLLFFFVQKDFVAGLTAGSIKA